MPKFKVVLHRTVLSLESTTIVVDGEDTKDAGKKAKKFVADNGEHISWFGQPMRMAKTLDPTDTDPYRVYREPEIKVVRPAKDVTRVQDQGK